jgi:hypothetical protein
MTAAVNPYLFSILLQSTFKHGVYEQNEAKWCLIIWATSTRESISAFKKELTVDVHGGLVGLVRCIFVYFS